MARIHASVGRGGRNLPNDVTTIQNLLNNHIRALTPLRALIVNGRCTPDTESMIEAFQSRILGHLSPDARIDPNGGTLAALNRPAMDAPRFQYPIGPQEPLADIAMPYIGATEARIAGVGNQMGTDPRMREIFDADHAHHGGITDGYNWCASFVSLCVEKLVQQHGVFSHIRPPRTAGVRQIHHVWAPAQSCLVFSATDRTSRPHRGDIVVYQRSHIGIVVSANGVGIKAVEGNTNAEGSSDGSTVRIQSRSAGEIRCFIRLPIPLTYDISNQRCTPQAG